MRSAAFSHFRLPKLRRRDRTLRTRAENANDSQAAAQDQVHRVKVPARIY